MVFYVVGNGFDLHYRLNTSYSAFKTYLESVDRDVVERVDDLFYRYNTPSNPDEIENWSSLEDMLEVFCRIDGDEILDEALSNAEQDDERAAYFDSPAWNVGFYTKYIDILKEEFVEWIGQFDVNIIKDNYFAPNEEDFILTFNYTETIERNYSINKQNILHIHGRVGEDLVIGHNEYQEPSLYNVVWDEDSDYRSTKAMEEVDAVLLKSAELYFKDSVSILRKHMNFFEHIDECEKVVFLGLSCGLQDQVYVEEIVSRAKNIDFLWYDEEAKDNIQYICEQVNPNVKINYIKW